MAKEQQENLKKDRQVAGAKNEPKKSLGDPKLNTAHEKAKQAKVNDNKGMTDTSEKRRDEEVRKAKPYPKGYLGDEQNNAKEKAKQAKPADDQGVNHVSENKNDKSAAKASEVKSPLKSGVSKYQKY
jgi:hypothetical protein